LNSYTLIRVSRLLFLVVDCSRLFVCLDLSTLGLSLESLGLISFLLLNNSICSSSSSLTVFQPRCTLVRVSRTRSVPDSASPSLLASQPPFDLERVARLRFIPFESHPRSRPWCAFSLCSAVPGCLLLLSTLTSSTPSTVRRQVDCSIFPSASQLPHNIDDQTKMLVVTFISMLLVSVVLMFTRL